MELSGYLILFGEDSLIYSQQDGQKNQTDFSTRLVHSIKGITHETLDVRLHALSKLKKLLREEREAFFQSVIGNETADPVVSQLISVLLKGCREQDPRVQSLYSECLGELGAVDPGRLELLANNPKEEMARFHSSIEEDNFVVGLINELVKSYLAATEPRIQDCSAYALQELLQVYQVSGPNEVEPSGSKLWKRFSEQTQEILIPLTNSKYMLKEESDWTGLQRPIYCSKKGNNYKDWVSTWTGYLSSKVKQEKTHRVFKSCSAASKHELNVALHILPHIVLHVLLDGSQEDIYEILAEINEVLCQVKRSDAKQRSGSDFHRMSAQIVFSVLDYLTRWKTLRAQMKAAETPAQSKGAGPIYLSDPGYMAVDKFLKQVPEDVLADACYICQAFTRSLMHFEQYVVGKAQYLQDHLDFMQRLYVAMDEPDGVLGVAAIRQSQPTLMEQILTHQSLGQQQEVQACYEQAIQSDSDNLSYHQGLLRSLMDLGQQSKSLLHATGVVAEKPKWVSQLNAYRVEAAWKLGSWDKLETYIRHERDSRNWAIGLGKVLLLAKEKKGEEFLKELEALRREQMGPLSAASMEMGSYQRGYEYIVRLMMLTEVEETARVLMRLNGVADDTEPHIAPADLLSQWQTRMQITQSSFRTQEPVLTLRRTLLTLVHHSGESILDKEIGQCWLWSAKIARKAGYLQTAFSALLQANDHNLPEFGTQKAKWLWEKGDYDQALSCLVRQMQIHFKDTEKLKADNTEEGKALRRVFAEALLLYGRYSEDTSNMESNAIVKQYREVIDILPDSEDGHFYLAKYYDKIMTTHQEDKDRTDISRQGEFIVLVVKSFGQSLRYGNQYIYQSMPRMLSLWFDFGSGVMEYEKKEKTKPSPTSGQILQKVRLTLNKLNKIIACIGNVLAAYQWFTAFPQLISRICHASADVFEQLKAIIARTMVTFPQQALWMMMAVSKSSYPMRVKRCLEIFSTAKIMDPSLNRLVQDATKLTERLLELCEKDFPSQLTVSVTQHFRPLKRLLDDSNFGPILLPLQSAMTVTLPNKTNNQTNHNPFPNEMVYIQGLEDTIEILPSLQRPKKITLTGSDGRLYVMMCKPKDDLRKDSRLMEFNGIVNKFLRKDPESRRRQLRIRTYAVIPLNEECGLIEWVNNTSGLRNILLKLYKEKGLYTSGRELKSIAPAHGSSLDNKLQIFKQKLLPLHPPVFREWFLRTFPDPTSWYNARLAYARTSAVISMVGYILGLGDRHGENILFDSTSGDSLHVDFNCLFNKGDTFEWPEKVPFRLTHNMVDAMGPMGFEGIFRLACEVTLRVMRDQMDPLMSVLRPFIYDPLVEWSKPAKGQRSNPTDSGEISNEQAMTHVQNIELRLKGNMKTKSRGLALSVEGHVKYLIQESTDERNLCQMYIGWAAYL
ncbi:hypothetical protein ACJMK2_043042 [Sinanodonta woodiana]|uniref:Serine/threonine-protein kinase ATR n=1 Tax=Sinanodonta woodiana TaxID=1069815 RepID=A0ABD3VYV2_SINWO